MTFIDEVLSGRIVLPMMPRVILQVLTELRREDAQMVTIAALVEQDPVLGSRILRMANTSYFSGKRSVVSMQDAVSVIGARPLTTLLVASGAQAAFADVQAVNLKAFWGSANHTAIARRRVAEHMKLDKEAAYSAGLLSTLGHLILCQCMPDKARRTFTRMRSPWGAELARQEELAFGASHEQVSAIWVDKLGLPSHVVRAIALCHSGPGTAAPPLARALQIGLALATALVNVPDGPAMEPVLPEALLAVAGLPDYVTSGTAAEDLAELAAAPIAA